MVHRQISIGSSLDLDFVNGLARMPLELFDRQSHTVASELWDCVSLKVFLSESDCEYHLHCN